MVDTEAPWANLLYEALPDNSRNMPGGQQRADIGEATECNIVEAPTLFFFCFEPQVLNSPSFSQDSEDADSAVRVGNQ